MLKVATSCGTATGVRRLFWGLNGVVGVAGMSSVQDAVPGWCKVHDLRTGCMITIIDCEHVPSISIAYLELLLNP